MAGDKGQELQWIRGKEWESKEGSNARLEREVMAGGKRKE